MLRDLLVSDLHLSDERPSITDRFVEFLAREATRSGGLYILGDLFDYWVGDDELSAPGGDPLARRVADALKALARGGHIGLFMGGTTLRENWTEIARWIVREEKS